MSENETTERGNVTVEGGIDAGFRQYGVPKQTTEDENGDEETVIWPDHIDPEDLTDKQRRVLELAFSNPTISASEIDDKIGSDRYAYQVLKNKVPEWYEDVFKTNGRSVSGWEHGDTTEEADTEPEAERETDIAEIVEALKRTAVHEETEAALEVVEEYL